MVGPVLPKQAKYNCLAPLGYSKIACNFAKAKPDSFAFHPLFDQFAQSFPDMADYIKSHITHREVGYSADRHKQQEDKMDHFGVSPDPLEDAGYNLALDYTYQMYRSCLISPFCPLPSLVPTSAPGFPYTHYGIPDKAAAVKSPLNAALLAALATPVALSCNKASEALPDEDLSEGKLRTVFATPTFFIEMQKYYFECQNVMLKQGHGRTWGKYGYVKQYRGFDALMRKLLPFSWVWDADVSGYDRVIYLLFAYEIRTRGIFERLGFNWKDHGPLALFSVFCDTGSALDLQLEQFRKDGFDRVTYAYTVYNSVCPVVAMHNGVIYRRPTGNNSGSNNTTTDNTLQHTIICMDLVIRLYNRAYDRFPTLEETREWYFLLFGDDKVGGAPEWAFSSPDDLASFVTDHYKNRHGLVIKRKAFNIVHKLPGQTFSGISFLGATAKHENGLFVPYPRVGKLAYSLSTFMRCDDPSDYNILVAKISAIYDLISPCDELLELTKCVSQYARFVNNQLALDPSVTVDRSPLDYALTGKINWDLYMGYETQSSFIFFGGQVDGGIKVSKRTNEQQQQFTRHSARQSAPASTPNVEWTTCVQTTNSRRSKVVGIRYRPFSRRAHRLRGVSRSDHFVCFDTDCSVHNLCECPKYRTARPTLRRPRIFQSSHPPLGFYTSWGGVEQHRFQTSPVWGHIHRASHSDFVRLAVFRCERRCLPGWNEYIYGTWRTSANPKHSFSADIRVWQFSPDSVWLRSGQHHSGVVQGRIGDCLSIPFIPSTCEPVFGTSHVHDICGEQADYDASRHTSRSNSLSYLPHMGGQRRSLCGLHFEFRRNSFCFLSPQSSSWFDHQLRCSIAYYRYWQPSSLPASSAGSLYWKNSGYELDFSFRCLWCYIYRPEPQFYPTGHCEVCCGEDTFYYRTQPTSPNSTSLSIRPSGSRDLFSRNRNDCPRCESLRQPGWRVLGVCVRRDWRRSPCARCGLNACPGTCGYCSRCRWFSSLQVWSCYRSQQRAEEEDGSEFSSVPSKQQST